MGRSGCAELTMPVERRTMEKSSSRVMSVGSGDAEKAEVCSWAE
jgi:hypothetical protein